MRSPLIFTASAIAFAGAARTARADQSATAACMEAHAEGQRAEQRGELNAATQRYASCTLAACPSAIRRDCTEWRERALRTMPTIIIRLRDSSGRDRAGRVFLDDVPLSAEQAGRAVSVDPGQHRIRVEAEDSNPTDMAIVAVEREKDRVVDVVLRSRETPPDHPPPARPREQPSPIGPLVLLGIGAVGVGIFTVAAIDANAKYDHYEKACMPTCAPKDVDTIRTRYVIADVALIVGLAAAATGGGWLFLQSRPRTSQTAWR
jgi:hypothetical protein